MRAARSWTLARRVVQYLALLAFVAVFVWSRRGGWEGDIVNIPMRLDPLAMLTSTLAGRTLLAGSALALVTVALTLALGRAWCGWLCPLGTVLDLVSLDRWRGGRKSPSDLWRKAKYGLLLVTVFAAVFAGLTLLVFDPLSILFRTLSVVVWPGADAAISAVEGALYQVSWLGPLVSAFDGLARPRVLPPEPALYRYTFLFAAVFAGVVLLNLAARRYWCRYLCPLGAMLGLMAKVSFLRRRVNDRCVKCDACARVCPTGTIQVSHDYASDPGECAMCLECKAACPAGAVSFPARLPGIEWQPYDPGRRQALLGLGLAVAGVSILRANVVAARPNPYLIQPPGGRENNLLSKCVRCGQCVRACPTSAIQPSVAEAGLEGLWTPVLVPRLGYCDYSCNACGKVCPVQAIPPLELEDKRKRVIGLAAINKDRCIPYADRRDCIVCEEMCPIPDKAIVLEKAEVLDNEGRLVIVQQPRVIKERCNGCGICECKCPVGGEAAIRVYSPATNVI